MEVKVSIIIPNYNHVAYLQQRIESVINQTYQDFELIILDDASTDGSQELLNDYKNHPKVSYLVINETNSGSPFIQWRKGIELAKGDFIWIAESDDFADVNFLKKTVEVLASNPKCNLVYTDSNIVDAKNNFLGHWSERKNAFFKTDRWDNDYLNNGIREIVQYLFYMTTINNTSAVLFRKVNLASSDFLNRLMHYKNAGDLYTYMVFALQGEIAYISLPLNFYRDHEHNVTKNNMSDGRMYEERINCYSYVLEKIAIKNEAAAFKVSINKALNYILLKNGFKLVDFNQIETLFIFIRLTTQFNFVSWRTGFIYKILFKIYSLRVYKVSNFCKTILKNKLYHS